MSGMTVNYTPNTAVAIEVSGFTGAEIRSSSFPGSAEARLPSMIKFSRMIGAWVAEFVGGTITIKEGRGSQSSDRLTVTLSRQRDVAVKTAASPGEQIKRFKNATSVVIYGKPACRIEVNTPQSSSVRQSPLPTNDEVSTPRRSTPDLVSSVQRFLGGNNSRSSPLPANNEVRSPLPANNEVRSPLPANNEVRSPLPANNELRSPLPVNNEASSPSVQTEQRSNAANEAQEKELARLREELSKKDEEIAGLKKTIDDGLEELVKAKGAQLMALNTKQLAAIESIKENNIALENAEKSLAETQKKADRIQSDLDAKNAQLAELNAKAEVMSLDCEKAMRSINEIKTHAKLDNETAELLEDGVVLKYGTVTDSITGIEQELEKVDEKIALIIRLQTNYNTELQNSIDTGSGELSNTQESGGQ